MNENDISKREQGYMRRRERRREKKRRKKERWRRKRGRRKGEGEKSKRDSKGKKGETTYVFLLTSSIKNVKLTLFIINLNDFTVTKEEGGKNRSISHKLSKSRSKEE